MTKALIIGAGVAGPIAAMALQGAGVDAEIFEATRARRMMWASSDKVAGPVARVSRDLFMPRFLRRVAGNGASSLAWMHRYHIDWDAPVVPDAAASARSTGT